MILPFLMLMILFIMLYPLLLPSRYIPPGRSLLEVTLRLRELLHADWRQEAEDLLGERIRTKGEVSTP
ncbi:hypothetical protein DL93DRAFT_2092049 [Clavulina sp. PMI_390]|nr:hypothetical protein DL93DRAFT_2092049 [Clavulina sp. PMI_390]